MSPLDNVRIFDFPEICDPKRGMLTVTQEGEHCWPFPVRRVFYIHDVPQGVDRGGHAHRSNQQLLICPCGSMELHLTDGTREMQVNLNRTDMAVLVPNGVWNDLRNFAPGTVLLVLCSEPYNTDGYLNDFEEYRQYIAQLQSSTETNPIN